MSAKNLNAFKQIADRFLEQHPGLQNLCITIFEDADTSGLRNVPENQVGGLIRGHNHLIVFANNITGGHGEFQKILRHEAFSHFAIDCLPTDKRQKLYDDVTRTLLSDKAFHHQYLSKIEDRYGKVINNDNIEEYFSTLAEKRIELSFSRQVIGKVRQIIRDALHRLDKSIDFNELDTQYFLHDFIKKVSKGDIRPSSTRMESMRTNRLMAPSTELLQDRVQVWRNNKSDSPQSTPSKVTIR